MSRFLLPSRCRPPAGLSLIELVVVLAVLVALGGLLVPALTGVTRQAKEETTQATLRQLRDSITGPNGYRATMRHARDLHGEGVGGRSGLPWPGPQEIAEGRADHPQLAYLFTTPAALPEFDPVTQIGWRGPYLHPASAGRFQRPHQAADGGSAWPLHEWLGRGWHADHGQTDDPAPLDGWLRPIVIQYPAGRATLPGMTAPLSRDDRLQFARLISAGANGVFDTPADQLLPDGDDRVLYLFIETPLAEN